MALIPILLVCYPHEHASVRRTIVLHMAYMTNPKLLLEDHDADQQLTNPNQFPREYANIFCHLF